MSAGQTQCPGRRTKALDVTASPHRPQSPCLCVELYPTLYPVYQWWIQKCTCLICPWNCKQLLTFPRARPKGQLVGISPREAAVKSHLKWRLWGPFFRGLGFSTHRDTAFYTTSASSTSGYLKMTSLFLKNNLQQDISRSLQLIFPVPCLIVKPCISFFIPPFTAEESGISL